MINHNLINIQPRDRYVRTIYDQASTLDYSLYDDPVVLPQPSCNFSMSTQTFEELVMEELSGIFN